MRFFFAYLWRSPLIRLAIIWFVVALAGITVFSWRLTDMRQELIVTNTQLQANIAAIQQIDLGKEKERKNEIDSILEDIERYRPSVEELLNFVKAVETLASQNKVYLFFHTIKTQVAIAKKNENFVTYKAGFTGNFEQVQNFLDGFEKLPYATDIASIDINLDDSGSYILRLVFILYTKL